MISAKNSRGGVKYLILLFCFIFFSFSVQAYNTYSENFTTSNFSLLDMAFCELPAKCSYEFQSGYVAAKPSGGSPVIRSVNGRMRFLGNGTGDLTAYPIFAKNINSSNIGYNENFSVQFTFKNLGANCYGRVLTFQATFLNQSNGQNISGSIFNLMNFNAGSGNCVSSEMLDQTCNIYNLSGLNVSSNNQDRTYIISKQALKNKACLYVNDDNLKLLNFSLFDDSFSGNGGSMWELDNLKITDQPNSKPVINEFSHNTSACWDKNDTAIDISLLVNVTDPENDQIYYSIDPLTFLLRHVISQEDFEENNKPDLDFFTRGNYVSNNTYPDSLQENSDFVAFNFDWVVNGQNLKHGIGSIGNNNYLLTRLEDAAAWYYQSEEPLRNASFIDFDIAFPSVENGLDYVLFDSFGNRLINISFHLNESEALKIYQDGILNKTIQFSNFHSGNYTGYIFVVNLFTPAGLTILIQDKNYILNETLHKSISIQDFDRVGFFTHNRQMQSYDAYSPVWILGNLKINGWNYDPFIDWSTEIPTTIGLNDSDLNIINLYVTDSYHLTSDDYQTELLLINPPLCQYQVNQIGDDNIVGIFGGMTRNAVVDYLNAIGLYELGRKVVWLFFFFILIGMIAAEYMILRRVDFTFPLIAASGICMLMSLAALYVAEIIAFGLLLAFSLAAPLAIHFLSGENGRN